MVYVFGTVEKLKRLSIGGGGGGGGGSMRPGMVCRAPTVCVCVGYDCFKTSWIISLLPYNRHAQ